MFEIKEAVRKMMLQNLIHKWNQKQRYLIKFKCFI